MDRGIEVVHPATPLVRRGKTQRKQQIWCGETRSFLLSSSRDHLLAIIFSQSSFRDHLLEIIFS
jgi:hypothetical protein